MLRIFLKISLFSLLVCSLLACSTTMRSSPATMSELKQGQRLFETGYYKRAMRDLLPLASDGNPEAQYAVGYMYYYGYGVTQDTDVGYFWINRSASQDYAPAKQALAVIAADAKNIKPFHANDKLR
ncbi:MAG: hypothetical protein ACD_46C00246G0005 [uncultured bacterium]|nr:MAG: hypothetical protein ACD_46C00246G0005 [uncultured bacterium]